MEKYGETLKQIRKSLNMSQNKLSNGIMSQSNYSKVENGEIDIPFSKMTKLLDKLGMSMTEFIYIHQKNQKTPEHQLSRLNQLMPGDLIKIKENIHELKAIKEPTQREEEILAIFEALDSIAKDDYETANEKVTMVWKRLKKHDTWYLYDIRLINSILYLFPTDVAGSIVNLALKRLDYYKNLRNFSKTSANLQINYLLLLMKDGEYQKALATAEKLIDYSLKHHLDQHLAATYVRKGIILENLQEPNSSEWYKKGFDLLEIINNKKMIQELTKEMTFYSG